MREPWPFVRTMVTLDAVDVDQRSSPGGARPAGRLALPLVRLGRPADSRAEGRGTNIVVVGHREPDVHPRDRSRRHGLAAERAEARAGHGRGGDRCARSSWSSSRPLGSAGPTTSRSRAGSSAASCPSGSRPRRGTLLARRRAERLDRLEPRRPRSAAWRRSLPLMAGTLHRRCDDPASACWRPSCDQFAEGARPAWSKAPRAGRTMERSRLCSRDTLGKRRPRPADRRRDAERHRRGRSPCAQRGADACTASSAGRVLR